MTTPNDPYGTPGNPDDQDGQGNENIPYGNVPNWHPENAAPNGLPSFSDYASIDSHNQVIVPERPRAGIRFLAFMIDLLIWSMITAALLYVISGDDIMVWMDAPLDAPMPTSIQLTSVLGTVGYFLYRALMESSSTGGSLGKMWTGQRVVTFEGNTVSFGQAAMRNLYYFAPNILGRIPVIGTLASIGYAIWYAMDLNRNEYRQSMTDRWAKTYVIKR